MKAYCILFAVGKDRPGIVSDVSGYLFDNGANIVDSRMAVMGGRFALTTLFSCDELHLDDIKSQVTDLNALGLSASFHDAEAPSSEKAAAERLDLTIQAMDHAGIVNRVVRLLHSYDVNIESLDTQVSHAPFSGDALFNMHLKASMPPAVSARDLIHELKDLAEAEDLDMLFG